MLNLENEKYFQYEIIGEFRSDCDWIHPTRTMDSYELIFVLDGTVYLDEDGTDYTLHTNQIIILEPNKPHFGYKISPVPTSFYWFHFHTNIEIPCKTYVGNEFYDIKYLLKKLLHISNTPAYPLNTTDAIGLLLFQELLYRCNSTNVSNHALTNEIAEYIRINSNSCITVGEVSEYFGYNRDYIGKLFKQNFRIGLKEYIASERVKIAKDLLLTSNFSVKQISAKLGFSDETLFIKYFMYHEDISPTKFRNKYYNTHMNNR